jgi:hypothetical protein
VKMACVRGRVGRVGGVCVRSIGWRGVGGGVGVREDMRARARALEHKTALRPGGCVNVCMGSQYLSVTHVYTDTQSHKCAQMVEFSGEYGNTWMFGTLGLRYPWIFGTLVLRYSWILGLLGVRNPGTLGSSEPPEIRYPSVGSLGSSDSIGAWRCQVPVESADPRVPIWIFGSSDSRYPRKRYPLVGALGSSDSITALSVPGVAGYRWSLKTQGCHRCTGGLCELYGSSGLVLESYGTLVAVSAPCDAFTRLGHSKECSHYVS